MNSVPGAGKFKTRAAFYACFLFYDVYRVASPGFTDRTNGTVRTTFLTHAAGNAFVRIYSYHSVLPIRAYGLNRIRVPLFSRTSYTSFLSYAGMEGLLHSNHGALAYRLVKSLLNLVCWYSVFLYVLSDLSCIGEPRLPCLGRTKLAP